MHSVVVKVHKLLPRQMLFAHRLGSKPLLSPLCCTHDLKQLLWHTTSCERMLLYIVSMKFWLKPLASQPVASLPSHLHP
jgi:hypothetical protein